MSAEHHVGSLKTYGLIFGALLIGTGATVFFAFLDLGIVNAPVALAIACIKAALVVLFFMHVKDSSRMTKTIVVGAIFWVCILFTLSLTDYLTRGWH